ncbi:hypothetical protein [Actinokineospora sp. UTMC 2448]|uniref:hypothetical protein n=1 Tax=Actinokineospora sp. UTMC 2448 TaxID=2268449 RepID=UPI002164397D|nr:hypothetical protein [Actinokineospora sp. UTMC 2448]UVS80225.1 hypothetical protein Actkin_03975 [Actinokineospora sp. UTMC 2448]
MARRRIGGAGGGSDKGPRKAGAVLVGAVLAVGAAHSGGLVSAGSGVTARAADAKKVAKSGKGNAWSRLGMRVGKTVKRSGADCAAAAFGDIRTFFLRTPCRSLDRKLYPLTLDNGAVVAVSVVWVGFRTRGQAEDFRALHRIHGNGDIRPPAPGVTFTGHHYDSRVQGTSVVIAETEAVSGAVDRDLLTTVAEVAVLFPQP